MTALVVGDLHFSDRAPSSRRDTYTADILRKLEWIVDLANHGDVPLILAGDVFHIKTPWRTSYWLIQAVHERLKHVDAGVWIVPGNHDLSGDRLESVDSQPIGALCRMGNVKLLMGWDEELNKRAGFEIFGVPYLREFDDGDWQKALGQFITDRCVTVDWELIFLADLVVTHAPLFPPGNAPGVFASIDPLEWAKLWGPSADATYYGHIHDPHGTYAVKWADSSPHKPFQPEHVFSNQGAISRGSLHEQTINRRIAVTRIDKEENAYASFTRIELPHCDEPGHAHDENCVVRPPADVYLFAEAAQGKAQQSAAQAFTDALGTVQLANLTVEEVIADIKAGGPDPEVLVLVERFLEEAGR